jgi:glutamate 5-kinase
MTMMRAVKNMKKRKSVITPYVDLVEQMTARTNSGSVVIVVSGGTMGSVSRSRLHEPSTSSTTNAQIAATRGQEPSVKPWCDPGVKRQIIDVCRYMPSCLACRLAFHFE